MPRSLLCLLIFGLFSFTAAAQPVFISGRVTDIETESGISFASVFIKGSDTAISADFDGYYRIQLKSASGIIGAKCVGYQTYYTTIRRGKHQTVNFELERVDTNTRQKYVLKKSEAAALNIVHKIIAKKASHNKKALSSYGYEAYTKIQVDLIDLTEHFMKRKLFKPFKFVFDNIDSTSEVKPFLPFFLTETVSDYYHQKHPRASREIIKASQVSGVDDLSISQFLGISSLETDVNNEYVQLLRRQFISPISSLGLDCYNYYLEDSQVIDHLKCFKVRFTPKSLKLAQLEGEMWIVDSAYAVKRIRLKMQNPVKLNPIHSISLYDEFVPVGKGVWMLKREILGVNAIRFNNTPEMVLRKTTYFSNFVINEKRRTLDSIFKQAKPDVAVSDSANTKSEAYWQRIRRNASSPLHEEKVYDMIDTLADLKITKRYINLFQAIFIGYVDVGPLSIGNIYSFISRNRVEGWRFKYGMRTNSDFSKRVRLGAYGAYSLRDHKGHYGGEVLWLITKEPRISISASYKYDEIPTRDYNTF
jgi:hypothetical protein